MAINVGDLFARLQADIRAFTRKLEGASAQLTKIGAVALGQIKLIIGPQMWALPLLWAGRQHRAESSY